MFGKRLFDLVSSIFGLTVLTPFFAIFAILIKLDSPGPVFHRGVRIGLNGVPFRIFKFRTMVVGAELSGVGVTVLGDSRVTRFGTWLRKYKFDELPQAINVITGEMSVVGPRPEVPQYTDTYTEEEKLCLTVKPGITDTSSVRFFSLDEIVGSGDSGVKMFEEKILKEKNQLRVKYVREQSFGLDMKIIRQTFLKLFVKISKAIF
jgi:lipopolysaccharide/colanic/teichoic acid biosynthesis glycosyltransferase